MKFVRMTLYAALILSLASCYKDRINGSGPVVTESRNIVNYGGLDLRVSADVFFKQDPTYKVEVSAQQNILEVLETYVSGNNLVIRFENDVRVRSHDPITVIVWGPSLDRLRISGSGNISTQGPLQPGNMEMDISGSGNITVAELITNLLDANISGSGNIKVNTGTAAEKKLRISGSGNIDVANVVASKAITHTSGSGDMRVHATQDLNVTISGSGNVYYKANPIIHTSISGSGKVLPF
jgi:hypothetical protein